MVSLSRVSEALSGLCTTFITGRNAGNELRGFAAKLIDDVPKLCFEDLQLIRHYFRDKTKCGK